MKGFILIAILFQVPKVADGWSRVTSRPVNEEPVDIQQTNIDCEHCRFSDLEKNLTVVKDKRLYSCFVTGPIDRKWTLAREAKEFVIQTHTCDTVDSDDDYVKLRSKAGPHIADMCKKYYIFWVNIMDNEPPLSPPLSSAPDVCRYTLAPPDKDTPLTLPVANGNGQYLNNGEKFDDTSSMKPKTDEITPKISPNKGHNVNQPLVPGSFPSVTDTDGLIAPPLLPGFGDINYSSRVQRPDGSPLPLVENNGNLVAPPLMASGGVLGGHRIVNQPVHPPFYRDAGQSPWPLNVPNSSGKGNVNTDNIESPPPPAVYSANNGNSDDSNNSYYKYPYAVPTMGSMETPGFAMDALFRLLMNNDAPAESLQDTVAPPPPDMRTPAPPKELMNNDAPAESLQDTVAPPPPDMRTPALPKELNKT